MGLAPMIGCQGERSSRNGSKCPFKSRRGTRDFPWAHIAAAVRLLLGHESPARPCHVHESPARPCHGDIYTAGDEGAVLGSRAVREARAGEIRKMASLLRTSLSPEDKAQINDLRRDIGGAE